MSYPAHRQGLRAGDFINKEPDVTGRPSSHMCKSSGSSRNAQIMMHMQAQRLQGPGHSCMQQRKEGCSQTCGFVPDIQGGSRSVQLTPSGNIPQIDPVLAACCQVHGSRVQKLTAIHFFGMALHTPHLSLSAGKITPQALVHVISRACFLAGRTDALWRFALRLSSYVKHISNTCLIHQSGEMSPPGKGAPPPRSEAGPGRHQRQSPRYATGARWYLLTLHRRIMHCHSSHQTPANVLDDPTRGALSMHTLD